MLFNRGEVYTIIADSETNFWVQKFAENHAAAYTVIGVVSQGDKIHISFRSKEKRSRINKLLKSTFETVCNVQVCEYLAFVTKR